MRYRKVIKLPVTCGCGKPYSLDHSQICKVGGLIHMRHDGLKNLFARLAREVFRDVEIEPGLAELSGETMDLKSANIQADARADVRIKGFYTERQNAFFDFRGFYPCAKSLSNKKLDAVFAEVAQEKKRQYSQRGLNESPTWKTGRSFQWFSPRRVVWAEKCIQPLDTWRGSCLKSGNNRMLPWWDGSERSSLSKSRGRR